MSREPYQIGEGLPNLQPLPEGVLQAFLTQITWILGNGKDINIWEDSVLGAPALSTKARSKAAQRLDADQQTYTSCGTSRPGEMMKTSLGPSGKFQIYPKSWKDIGPT
jgi:hypothetical protein